ncbi:hypothetical protein ACF1HJ_11415 [Streptomyces sp. NPDC013978]|uniref:hypothetical protein n=1 Tax=Streptomyces sp. NPDC013978 TaxID=3364869 RepID=UPI0036FFA45D
MLGHARPSSGVGVVPVAQLTECAVRWAQPGPAVTVSPASVMTTVLPEGLMVIWFASPSAAVT